MTCAGRAEKGKQRAMQRRVRRACAAVWCVSRAYGGEKRFNTTEGQVALRAKSWQMILFSALRPLSVSQYEILDGQLAAGKSSDCAGAGVLQYSSLFSSPSRGLYFRISQLVP